MKKAAIVDICIFKTIVQMNSICGKENMFKMQMWKIAVLFQT